MTELFEQIQVVVQALYELVRRYESSGTGIVVVINYINKPQLLKLSDCQLGRILQTSCDGVVIKAHTQVGLNQ